MSPATSFQDTHSNSNQEPDGRPQRLPQPQGTHQGYSKSLNTLPQVLGVGQRSMEQTHLSSDHLTVDDFQGSYTRELPSTTKSRLEAPNVATFSDNQDSRTPYQNRTDPWYPTPNTATMFQSAHGLNINGQPHFVNIANVNQLSNLTGSQGLENFRKSVSLSAFHDSSAQELDRQVNQVLRKNTLRQLQDWTDSPIVTERIIWLHGPASIGKTAIALEIAWTGREKMAATFFFSRTDTSRSDGNRLFPTLAWQFMVSIPDIKNHIIHSINERPDLPNKGVEAQFEYLIAQPFAAMKESTSTVGLSGLVVVIDGVDECADTRLQRRILKVIGNAIQDPRVPLRFIISSRPDPNIQETFHQVQCPIFCIDLAKFSPAEEIKMREEEIGKREVEIKTREEGVRKGEEELRKREVEIGTWEEGIRKREEEIRKREVEIRTWEERIGEREEEIRRREENISEFAQAPDHFRHVESDVSSFLMPTLPPCMQGRPNYNSQLPFDAATRSSSPESGKSTNPRREGSPHRDARIVQWLHRVPLSSSPPDPEPPADFGYQQLVPHPLSRGVRRRHV